MTPTLPPISEAELSRLVTDAATLFGWSWLHFRPARTVRGWRTPVEGPLGEGFVDLILLRPRDQRLLFVEVKSGRGRVSPEQAHVHQLLRDAGQDVRVVRPTDLDDILEALR